MTQWIYRIAMIVALLAILLLPTLIEKRRSKRRRGEFLRGRTPVSDDDFTRALGLANEVDCRLASAIRRAVALQLKVPAEMIHPTDAIQTLLFDLQCQVPDLMAAAQGVIAHELSIPLDPVYEFALSENGRGPLDAATFGGYVGFYIEYFHHLIRGSAVKYE